MLLAATVVAEEPTATSTRTRTCTPGSNPSPPGYGYEGPTPTLTPRRSPTPSAPSTSPTPTCATATPFTCPTNLRVLCRDFGNRCDNDCICATFTPAGTPTPTPTSCATASPPGCPPGSLPLCRDVGNRCDPGCACVILTRTPTVSPSPPRCTGDCNGDGRVTVDELTRGVGLFLRSESPHDVCPATDVDFDGRLQVTELIQAVNNALRGCPATPTPEGTGLVATLTPTPTPSATDSAPHGPDLLVADIDSVHVSGPCQGPFAYVFVCVENDGDASAGPFDVNIAEVTVAVGGLTAGDTQCFQGPPLTNGPRFVEVTIDPGNVVAESDESNNVASGNARFPTVRATCRPTATATPSPP